MKFRGEGVTRAAYAADKTLFNEGDQGNAVFIIEKGAVAIIKTIDGQRVQLAVLKAGELFGEMALVDGSPRMAAAVTLEPSVIARIPREIFEAKLAGFDPFLRALVEILINNLRNVHTAYMKRPRSVPDHIAILRHGLDGFRRSVDRLEDATARDAASKRLVAVVSILGELEQILAKHQDRRRNVVSDADLAG